MTTRIAINGFGRIGRLVLRALMESGRRDLEVAAVNDLGCAHTLAHLLKYDSVHGVFAGAVGVKNGTLAADGRSIRLFCEADPSRLPWKSLGIDIAFECSGRFTARAQAAAHLRAGAKRVLVSAPSKGADVTVVYGVNHNTLSPSHEVVSNASCTTNCLAPVVAVVDGAIGFERGHMTTVHATTGDQPTVDSLHKDLRRGRAAGRSMVPTSTGAARAVTEVLPHLAGRLDGAAIRVPTTNVSLIDLVFTTQHPTTREALNDALRKASGGDLAGILEVNDAPLVSCDFNHCAASATVECGETAVIDGRLCRVLAWYDNEWGFSNRMLDVAAAMARVMSNA